MKIFNKNRITTMIVCGRESLENIRHMQIQQAVVALATPSGCPRIIMAQKVGKIRDDYNGEIKLRKGLVRRLL